MCQRALPEAVVAETRQVFGKRPIEDGLFGVT